MNDGAQARGTTTRSQLVSAAKELLWERGYEATSPRAILAASGAGQGSMYHHFAGKTDLAATALREVSIEMCAVADTELQGDEPPLARVRAYLTRPRAALRGCRLGRIAAEAAMTDDTIREPVATYFAHVEQGITDALKEAQRDGTFPESLDAASIAATLLAVVQGGYVLARGSQDVAQFDRAIAGALALLDGLSHRYTHR